MKNSIIGLLTNIAINKQLSFLVPEEYGSFISGTLEMLENDPCFIEIDKLDKLIYELDLLNKPTGISNDRAN